MIKRDLQNEKLDRIGRRLLKTAKLSSEEIEQIVASPRLFDAVRAGIQTEKQSRRKSKRFFSDWVNVSFLRWQTAAGISAILLVFAISLTVIIFKKQDTVQLVEQTIETEAKQQITQTENSARSSEIKQKKNKAVENPARMERAALKVKKREVPIRARKPKTAEMPQGSEKQSPEVFYSLAIGGNWEADGEDLQVVRAELSRSELFALGVNLPDENEISKIKTDLLVGSNGVPQAIRFVE